MTGRVSRSLVMGIVAGVLLVTVCAVCTAEDPAELWGGQALGVWSGDSWATAGQFSFASASWGHSAIGYGNFELNYDLFPGSWYAAIVYDWGSGMFTEVLYTLWDLLP